MGFAIEHLSKADRERITRLCFTVKKVIGDELHGLCPFHNDKNPSFSYNLEKDVFNCLVETCGAKGDIIDLWCHDNNISRDNGGFKAFCEFFGIDGKANKKNHTNLKRKPPAKAKIIAEKDWQKLTPMPDNWITRCKEKFGWSDEVIKRFDLRLRVKDDEKRIAIPIRDATGKIRNIRLYLPDATENKVISWGAGYGAARLFPLPSFWGPNTMYLCEGEKDTLCALSQGINAVTVTLGSGTWKNGFNSHFKGRDVIICYDADKPGQAGAQKVASKLIDYAKSVRILKWPDYMGFAEKHGEDFTDFFMKHSKSRTDFLDLLESAITVNKEEMELEEGPYLYFGGKKGTRFLPALLAKRIMQDLEIISDPETGIIYRWNGKYWQLYDLSYIRNKALTMLGDEASSSRAADVANIIRDMSILPHERKMNDQANLICLKNGMFDIEKYELVPFDKEFYASHMLNVEYKPGTKYPTWNSFAKQSLEDSDVILEVQKFFAYCLTRETRYEKCLLLIGPGGDGKSTLLNVLQEMVGEDNCSNISMGALEDQFYRSRLVDKLLNVSSEIEARAFSSDIFKAIISGDKIGAAFKHQTPFDFRPFCKLAFASNKHPRILDTSDGFYRKLIIVEMKQQFVKRGKADIYLKEKLLQEISGVFEWALEGLVLLRSEGFLEPETIRNSLKRYKQFNSPVLCFVEESISLEPDGRETKKDIYNCFKAFCRQWGYHPMSVVNFGRELNSLIPELKDGKAKLDGKRENCYIGIRLNDNCVVDAIASPPPPCDFSASPGKG